MRIRWFILIMLLFAPAAWGGAPIVVLGDSLSANYGIARERGWVSLLQQRLSEQQYEHEVVNASISGETTSGGRSRIHTLLATHKPGILILELGANDGLRGLPPDATEANLAAIIQACQSSGTRVLLVGMRLPPNYGATYAGRFSSIYPALAKKFKTPLLPLLLKGMGDRRELFQADQLHPSEVAQPAILENIWTSLKPML